MITRSKRSESVVSKSIIARLSSSSPGFGGIAPAVITVIRGAEPFSAA